MEESIPLHACSILRSNFALITTYQRLDIFYPTAWTKYVLPLPAMPETKIAWTHLPFGCCCKEEDDTGSCIIS